MCAAEANVTRFFIEASEGGLVVGSGVGQGEARKGLTLRVKSAIFLLWIAWD